MPNPTIRVSLPGFDAGTDTNPDHFALYADSDWVLIKQQSGGTQVLAAGASGTVVHNLGYVPFFLVFTHGSSAAFNFNGSQFSGYFQPTSGGVVSAPLYDGHADGTNLIMTNNDSATGTFNYFIFYDQQV